MDINKKQFFIGKFESLKEEYYSNGCRSVIQEQADKNCMSFLEAGVTDLELLLEMMSSESINRHFKAFTKLGVHIDTKRMLEAMSPQAIPNQIDVLKERCDIDDIVDNMYIDDIQEHLFKLMCAGASIERMKKRFESEGRKINYEQLLDGLSSKKIAKNLNLLLRWECDPDDIVSRISTKDVEDNIIMLMYNGAQSSVIAQKLRRAGEYDYLLFNRALFEAYYPHESLHYMFQLEGAIS